MKKVFGRCGILRYTYSMKITYEITHERLETYVGDEKHNLSFSMQLPADILCLVIQAVEDDDVLELCNLWDATIDRLNP